MTIKEAVNKATEGGYHINGSDGIEAYYSGASSHYSAWTRKDNDSSFIVAMEETFLDPEFWQALGRALRWDHGPMTVHKVEDGRPTVVIRPEQHWLYHWHRFIDYLAAGRTPEPFFESFP